MSGGSAESDPTKPLVMALGRMLHPLVRLMIEKQLHFPFVSDLLKSIYVDVAEKSFRLEGKRQTVSRLSLLTGIHRREVKRISAEAGLRETLTPSSITLGAQMVARWTGEPPWIDEAGRPRPLPRTADDSDSISFHRLVNSLSVDIHPRSVLDEWVRLGVASIDEEGRVVLESGAFVPVNGFSEKAHYVGRNLRDHIAAAGHNLTSNESPFLERSVYYGSLPPEAIEELSQLAIDVGQEALTRVHLRARELKKEAGVSPPGEDSNRRRITFGVYLFDAPSSGFDSTDGPQEADNGIRKRSR